MSAVVVRQRPSTGLEDVKAQLVSAFETTRGALEAGDPVALVVHAPDLLGQGTLEDASVATGLLGLMRAVVFEGGSKGWLVNVIAVPSGDETPSALIETVCSTGLTGQVLTTGTAGVGKVIP
jgi:hypothetical protein